MAQNLLVSEEHPQAFLTLIVDKKGIFGDSIARHIEGSAQTVLVTAKELRSSEKTLVIPFHKDIPEIPEGTYSHIFFVWEGKRETLHLLEPLLEKAAADKAHFVFITDHQLYYDKLRLYIYQQYAEAKIIITGDVFGQEQYESIITSFFVSAHKEGVIRVRKTGLHAVYPVLFDDVVKAIAQAGFNNSKQKVLLACQAFGITELSIAHLFQKIDPLIKIDFIPDDEKAQPLPSGEYLFSESYHVTKKLQEYYAAFAVRKKDTAYVDRGVTHFSPVTEVKKQKKNTKKYNQIVILVLFFFVVLLSPILLTFFYEGLGWVLLYASVTTGRAGNFTQAAQFAQTGGNIFSLSQQTSTVAYEELQLVALSSVFNNLNSSLARGNMFSLLAHNGFAAAASFTLVTKGKSLSPYADFSNGVNDIKNMLIVLANNTSGSFDGVSLADVSQLITPYGSIVDALPSLFGFPEEKTYMILFQNNMELRPGGGFIGSYALVTIDKGRIGNITIHDVYDADGQLKGHVEPPFVIRRYIPQVHWYLRDSNFDVDFSEDAKNAAFFLKAETGQQVNGVIGVDLNFVKALLALSGPVYVPGYNQTVTPDNFFLLTESHAEKNTFAGSTQKKDFLRALFIALQTKLTTTHAVSFKTILPLLQAVQEKHIVFGFSDPLTQDVFDVSGLSSSLWDGRKEGNNTLLDFTGINEANIGVNKANAFVSRKVAQTVAITDDGSVSEKLDITYKNNSKPNQWPGGQYKNYLRIILPMDAKLTSISLDGVQQTLVPAVTDPLDYETSGFVPPQGLEVDTAVEKGKQLYGFLVTVPEQKDREVSIVYTLAQKLNILQPTLSYNGLLFKQPGLDDYPYTFSIVVPNSFSVMQKPAGFASDNNSVSTKQLLSGDTPFVVTFTKK